MPLSGKNTSRASSADSNDRSRPINFIPPRPYTAHVFHVVAMPFPCDRATHRVQAGRDSIQNIIPVICNQVHKKKGYCTRCTRTFVCLRHTTCCLPGNTKPIYTRTNCAALATVLPCIYLLHFAVALGPTQNNPIYRVLLMILRIYIYRNKTKKKILLNQQQQELVTHTTMECLI